MPPGLPYSVAAILAHMNANVRFNLGLIRSANPAAFESSPVTWPTVSPEEWPALVQAFLESMAELGRVARIEDLERVL